MRPVGDFSIQHLVLIDELIDMEVAFEENKNVPKEDLAMAYTSLSHDYFTYLFCEEEGERLIKKAERSYPGYFKKKIHDHIKINSDFDMLVHNLKLSLALPIMEELGFKE